MSNGTVSNYENCIVDIGVISIPMEVAKVVNTLLCLWLPKLLAKSDRAVDRVTISQCLTYCLTMGSLFIFSLTYHYIGWESRNVFCYFSIFALSFGHIYSFMTIIAIAVLRYLYCIHPFFMRNQTHQKITVYIVSLDFGVTFACCVNLMVHPQTYLVKCLGLENYRQKYRVPFLHYFILIAIFCYCRIAYCRFCKSNVSTRETRYMTRCMISVTGSVLNLLGMLLALAFGRTLMDDPCGPSGILLIITAVCGFTQVMNILTSNEIRRSAWNDVKNGVSCFFTSFQIPLKSQFFGRCSLVNVFDHVRQQNAVRPEVSVISSKLSKTLVSETCHEVMQTPENLPHFAVSGRSAVVAEMHDRNVNIGTDVDRYKASRSSQRMIHSDENLRQEAVEVNLVIHKNANDNSFLRDEMGVHSGNAAVKVQRLVWHVSSLDIASAVCNYTSSPAPESTQQTLQAFGQRRHSFPGLLFTRPCHSSAANRKIKATLQASPRLI